VGLFCRSLLWSLLLFHYKADRHEKSKCLAQKKTTKETYKRDHKRELQKRHTKRKSRPTRGLFVVSVCFVSNFVPNFEFEIWSKSFWSKSDRHYKKNNPLCRPTPFLCECIYIDLSIYICFCEYIYIYIYVKQTDTTKQSLVSAHPVFVWIHKYRSIYIYIYLWIYIYIYICKTDRYYKTIPCVGPPRFCVNAYI